MVDVVKLGVKRPATKPLLPDPEPRDVKYTFISVDDHLMEPPDTFKGRIPSKFGNRGPHVVETEEGHEVWVIEGKPYFQVGFMCVAGTGLLAGSVFVPLLLAPPVGVTMPSTTRLRRFRTGRQYGWRPCTRRHRSASPKTGTRLSPQSMSGSRPRAIRVWSSLETSTRRSPTPSSGD